MFIFSEDPPLKNKGHGLSVLLYNLFDGSDIEIERWFTFLPNSNIYKSDIQANSNLKFKILDIAPLNIFKKYAKLDLLYNQLVFFLFLPAIAIELRKHPTKPVFIPIGASAYILYKICLLKLIVKNPVWLYIVDDLKEIAEKQNQSANKIMCKLFLNRAYQYSYKIFAITDKLASTISQASGKRVSVILPCFQEVEKIKKTLLNKRDKAKFTYIFTGGLNFLYNDSLKIFSDFLNRLQEEVGQEYVMIVQTYSSKDEFDKIGFRGNVEYRTSENRADLYKTYEEADAFIVPYSFDQSNYTMISTSFPQKIAQIIQFGIPIVVFGPPYGSVIDFFKKEDLEYIIDACDYSLFKITILKLLASPTNTKATKNYLDVYTANFSQKACLRQLLKGSE